MSKCHLVLGGSTNSRGNRPLPPGAVSAQTVAVSGPREVTEFIYKDGRTETKNLLSWVGGQSGLLWAGGPWPESIQKEIDFSRADVHGSYGHRAEHDLADALGAALDGVFSSDAISCRFGLNGRDALDAAARVARAVTGRALIATEGSYHGAGESFIHPPFPQGIPLGYRDHVAYFKWGDVAEMRRLAKYCAAIVVDAPALDDEEVRPFLQEIRRACDEGGAVFVLDEVVSGFRFSLQGAAGYYGVKPDICTYGKALSATGGVSAIVGRRDMVDYLDGRTFFSLTFGGDPSRCAVAAATVRWLSENRDPVYGFLDFSLDRLGSAWTPDTPLESPGHLRRIGQALQNGMNTIFSETATPCVVKGQPERSAMVWDTNENWLSFCSKAIGAGVVLHRPQFPTLAHTMADVEKTLEVVREVLK